MPEKLPVSVVLAAYRGEKYIAEQIESIICQLQSEDELLISSDSRDDHTLQIALLYRKANPKLNIRLFFGPGQGVVRNFEFLLEKAVNPIVILSDQDDIWNRNKVEVIRKAFENPRVMAVVHDAAIVDENRAILEPSYYQFHGSRPGYLQNILRNSLIGCCMAVRKEVVEAALPFPEIPMHDQYLGLAAYRMGEVLFLKDCLIEYRRHAAASTDLVSQAPVFQQLAWRKQIIKAMRDLHVPSRVTEPSTPAEQNSEEGKRVEAAAADHAEKNREEQNGQAQPSEPVESEAAKETEK